MNEQAVRPALPGDAEAMCAIYNAAIAERSSTFETELRSAADFEARVADERFPLLVSNGDKGVIGWAGIASYSARPCYAGIGECSAYVAAAAEQTGFHKMIGKLFTDNLASVRLVEVAASRQWVWMGSFTVTGQKWRAAAPQPRRRARRHRAARGAKRELAERHRDDREAYTEAKSAFVQAILGSEARLSR